MRLSPYMRIWFAFDESGCDVRLNKQLIFSIVNKIQRVGYRQRYECSFKFIFFDLLKAMLTSYVPLCSKPLILMNFIIFR